MPFDGTTFKPLLAVLVEGRHRIETSWFRGKPGENVPLDGHCIVLSISRQNVGELTDPALRSLARAAYGSDNTVGLQPWNDAADRTKEEVLAVCDRAILASTPQASAIDSRAICLYLTSHD